MIVIILAVVDLLLNLLQISHSLVMILELSGVSEVQYKEIMMSSINKDN